jgi:alkylhydroperoxidase family enzyme
VSAHSALGKRAGLTDQDVLNSRRGTSADQKADVLLRFARTVVAKRGIVEDADIAPVREAGFGDAEIAEVVAHVALNIFTNYFNNVAGTTIDFPKAPALSA